MQGLTDLGRRPEALGVLPSLLVKSTLGREVLRELTAVDGLVRQKLQDYGLPPDLDALSEITAAFDPLAAEALTTQVAGALPEAARLAFDAATALAAVRDLLRELGS